ncbi:MATE family efflux transporter [Mangrovibacterium marinum]|uniref:Multidrug-efflux transporter n=1 Tax=Mangrovibacterium marinum TaxID=1639118 RepID=A0A2T5C3D7_9BACT|nr:MATE family efflux transporter [Mangrovibacterium marinum]PTN09281.1 putative MATE family efflux protein [Mangrovibacterium marinum]
MTFMQQLRLAVLMSVPAIIAQVSSIVMQYIDASMVGSLGANASASIGLVISSTWLFWGISTTFAAGFSVQVAHLIGAGNPSGARSVLRQALLSNVLFSTVLMVIGIAVSSKLPYWLGGEEAIAGDASMYFLIFVCSLPALQLNSLAGGMLRSSGNMHIPSILNVLMCFLDVCFNLLLIFPSRQVLLGGFTINIPGADLGVVGAALGTALAYLLTAAALLLYLFTQDPNLRLTSEKGSYLPEKALLRKSFRISTPMMLEHTVIMGAQILSTMIVAPLGVAAIAANSFAITAESLCYMPGFGIAEAATTLVGHSFGAARKDLVRRFASITVWMGMLVMTVMGAIMYVTAPELMGFMTPDPEILSLGVVALRLEAFAEPMFAAAIVAYGVFVGAGDTLVPSVMNFSSIWLVRLTLAALLAPLMGLQGVWMAMCLELCFRGIIFLIRLYKGNWLKCGLHTN